MPEAKLSAHLSVDNTQFEKGLQKGAKAFDKWANGIQNRGDKIIFRSFREFEEWGRRVRDPHNAAGFSGNAPGAAGGAGGRGDRPWRGGGGGAGRGVGVRGEGMLQASYFIDDVQYGMRGIMNNIPQLAMALGGGAGLAGALGIAAVAAGTLGPKIFDLATGFGKLKEETEEAQNFVDKMAKKEKEQRDRMEKEAENGTPAGQARLMEAMASALRSYNARTARDGAAARVGEHGRAGRDALERARIEGKDIPQSEKMRALGEIDLRAQTEGNAAQREGMKSQMAANTSRARVMEDAAVEAARRVAELEKTLKAIPDEKRADPTRRAAELRLEAGRVDAGKARVAADEINAEVLLANGALGQELNALTQRHLKEEEAARLRLKDAVDKQLEAELAVTAAQHQAYADEQVALGEESDKRAALLEQTREQLDTELAIATARAAGNTAEADRLQRAENLRQRQNQMEGMGFSPEEARLRARAEAVAQDAVEQRARQDATPLPAAATPRLSRSGRPRIGSPDGPTEAQRNAFRGIDAWRLTQRSSLRLENDAYIGAIDGMPKRRRGLHENPGDSMLSSPSPRENRRETPRNTREVRQTGGVTDQWGAKFIAEIQGLRKDLAVLTKDKSAPLRSGK